MRAASSEKGAEKADVDRLRGFWDSRYRDFSLQESGWLGAGEAQNRLLYACKEQGLCRALKKIGFRKGSRFRVLDAGCGQGFFAELYRRRFPEAEYVGVDLSGRVIQHLRSAMPWGQFFEGDIGQWRHPKGIDFDVIQLFEVLHLLLDDTLAERTLLGLASQLGAGGHLVITAVPLEDTVQPCEYIRHRGGRFFEEAFERAGLRRLRREPLYFWLPDGGPPGRVLRKVSHLVGPRLLYFTDRLAHRLRVPHVVSGYDSRMELWTLERL